jgi:hypothetical protein
LDALGAIQKQLQKLTTEGLNQQAAVALLEQRLDDVEVGSRSEPGDDAEVPAGGPTCIRCHVRPRAVDAVTGQRHPWCSRSCRDSAGDDGTRDDDDVSQTLTARPDRRSDPDATRPPSALGLLSRAYGFRHRYGEGSSGATFNINNTPIARRTHRGTRSGQNQRSGAAGGAGQHTSQRQNSQQQQQPSQQHLSSSRDSRGRQGQGRGGGAAGGGASRGGHCGGTQGGAGGRNVPAPPP